MIPELHDIRICEIRQDSTQSRAAYNRDAIYDYADLLRAHVVLPAADVYWDGETYWCGDGFHRLSAATAEAWQTYPCNVYQGGERDAKLHSIRSNHDHGIRRSNKDKRHVVTMALADSELSGYSNRKLADYCGVSDTLVADVREEAEKALLQENAVETTRVGKDGKKRKARKPKPSADESPAILPMPAAETAAEPTTPADPATDFDPTAIDAAPAEPPAAPKKSGSPTISRKTRQKAKKTFGEFVRSLHELGIYDEFSSSLDQMAERIEQV